YGTVNRGQNFTGNATCAQGNGADTWAGPIVTGGSANVGVTFNGGNVAVSPVSVSVTPRVGATWVWSPTSSSVEIGNSDQINCYGQINYASNPPLSTDHTWGQSCQVGTPDRATGHIGGHTPNDGFWYVTSVSNVSNIQFKYIITPAL